MSLLSLLFRTATSGSNIRTQIGLVTLDVTLTETHARTSRVTEFPIEGGGNINDHVSLGPKTLDIEGFVTDTPFEEAGLTLGRSRASTAYFLLEQLWQMRIPFACYSQMAIYPNMVIESLSVPNTRSSDLRFTCKLRQLTIVTGQNTVIPDGAGGSVPTTPGLLGLGGGAGMLGAGNVSIPNIAALGVDMGRQIATQATSGIAAKVLSLTSELGI